MKKVLSAVAAALIACLATPGPSRAAGFRLPDQDAAAMGMAGAFVGQADNPSAAWYNPAGITQLDGTRISVGVMAIYPVMTHENTMGVTEVEGRQVFFPVELFGTNRINDRISFGLGLSSPFGLSTDWSETSSTSSVATFSRIKTLDLNPNIAYAVSGRLSIAFGIDYIKLEATMERMIGPEMILRLNGDGSGWGANAGLLYKAGDPLTLGLSYRSRVKIKVDSASANVVGIPVTLSSPVKTDITLPDLVDIGGSYKVSDRLTLNAQLDYTWWSTYDRLVMESNTFLVLSGGLTDTAIDEKDWKNTWTFRVGGQYRISDQWKLRAGYVYDQSPVPEAHFETRTPDADRQGITLGTGYATGNVTIDASYMYLRFKNRTITDSLADGASQVLNGTYKSQAHILGVTVAYKF